MREGQEVKKGERLAEIELTEVNAQVEQAHQLAEKGQARYGARRAPLQRPGDQPRAAAGSAHPGVGRTGSAAGGAEFNRGYAVITAPGDGVILRKLAEERELVPAGQTVLIMVRRIAATSCTRSALRSRGRAVEARRSARRFAWMPTRARPSPARSREIAGAADSRSGMFPIEVRFDSVPVALASGLVGES